MKTAEWSVTNRGVSTVMRISSFGYLCREAVTSLRRNGWMALASAATTAVALMILGASLLMIVNVDFLATTMESQVEISVFLKDGIDKQRTFDIGEEMKKVPGVSAVKFVPKDDALAELRQQFTEKKGVLETLGENNPLPDKYSVKVKKPEQVVPVAQSLEKIADISKVRYSQGVVQKLFPLTKWVRTVGLIVMVLLGLAAVFLISTTIRLTVFARRREINIMKYLGATDWFIRWPFILEGIMLGLFGSLLAVLILYFAYYNLNQVMAQLFPFVPVQRNMSLIVHVYEILVVIGTVLGATGSLISVRKFLRV